MKKDVQGRALGLNDVLIIKFRSDNLKMFDRAWAETWMALDKEPQRNFLESLHHRQLEKSTLVKTALALSYLDQVHRTEQKSCAKLKALVADILEDQQQETLIEGRVLDKAIPVVPVTGKGDGHNGECRQWTSKGSRAKEVRHVHSSMMTRKEEKKKKR